jgi:hypothetical protein
MSRRSKLDDLSPDEYAALIRKLLQSQERVCYVCRKEINLAVNQVDIDHIISLDHGGPDSESNWGLTHRECNRAKGSRDLQLQRYLYRLKEHVEKYTNMPAQSGVLNFTLREALQELVPHRQDVGARLAGDQICLSFNIDRRPVTRQYTVVDDPKSGMRSFFGLVPTVCIHHDQETNPRSIVDLEPLIVEFYEGNPQLQPSLATLDFEEPEGVGQIMVFDGQHKAAAQLYIGNDAILARVFVNADKNRLKQVNFRAHTKLAQIHFPQLIEDRIGHDMYQEEFSKYLAEADLSRKSEGWFFNEQVQPQERSEFRQYFQSFLRYEVLTGDDDENRNRMLDFVETISVRSRRHPLSYDALKKTFLKEFLFLRQAHEPLAETEGYRRLERRNLVRLMNLFAEEALEGGRFDPNLGVYKIEERLAKDPDSVPDMHLRAYRLCRAPAMITWMKEFSMALALLLNVRRRYQAGGWARERPLWAEIQPDDWASIRRMIQAVVSHKIWPTKVWQEVIVAIASTKQVDWQQILLQGRLPGRPEEIFPQLNQNVIFRAALP